MQLLGVVELKGSKYSGKKNYQVWEGNRQVCAIKLLNDPDRAPAKLRRDFERLASGGTYTPIKTINCVVFDDHEDLKFWMGIIHDGAQNGVGLLPWDAQQKARHFGSGRNRIALAMLDAAEDAGFINKDERVGKLTTAQRFLNRSVVREALGIETANPDDITINRPVEDFRKQLGRFIADLKEGIKVTSRHNQHQIDQYGRKLAGAADISGKRVEPISLAKAAKGTSTKKDAKKEKSKKLRRIIHIEYDKDLAAALEALANAKLESLYNSLCNVRLDHAPLLAIGAWAFIESLAARAGKGPNTDFLSFYSVQRLGGYGLGNSNKQLAPIRDALERIQRFGNTTKHHEVSALFDGRQLANDFATITPIAIKTLESIGPKK